MKTKKILFFALLALLLQSCSKPILNVTKVSHTNTPTSKAGYFYALPRNYIRIDVVVNRTEQIKGPYAEFAEKYLGLTNVIKNNSTSYEINGLKLSTFAEPDPLQFYFVEPKSKACGKGEQFRLALTEAGLIVNTDSKTETSTIENSPVNSEDDETVYPDIFKYYADMNLFEKVDTLIEKVQKDSVTVEKMTFKRSMVEKTPEQKAKNAADFIIKVKENRFNLISGFQEVNYDKETFKYMNEELEKMENEYRILFTGISFTKQVTYSFIYLPKREKIADSVPLFRFSKLKGVLDTANGFGDLVYLKIKKGANTDTLHAYVDKKGNLKAKHHGFYYRIADYAKIAVYNAKSEPIEAKFLIPQYGIVTSMPALRNKSQFYPTTGTLKVVE
ncbi:MAG: DUF4831 family protein [Bacteroidota bacterium]